MSDDEDDRGESGNIEIFLRIKPIANPSKKVEYDLTEGKARPLKGQQRNPSFAALRRGKGAALRRCGAA